jgi:hypothetical protein
MRIMKITRRILVAAALAAVPGAAAAQQTPFDRPEHGSTRIPLTVVMVDSGFPASVFRRVSEPRNLLVVGAPTVTEQNLSDAIRAFLLQERDDPDGMRRGDNAMTRTRADQPSEPYPWTAEALHRLLVAGRRPMPLRLNGHVLELWIPPDAPPTPGPPKN